MNPPDSTHRHTIRQQLLANDYRPLPLVDKGIRIKGWVKAEINEEWLERFRRKAAYLNTGIRCDDLYAFDIDVLDEASADACEAIIEELCGPTDLCRVGRWPKRLLLYRAPENAAAASKSARTGKYRLEGQSAMVELLCSRGRQFAAFGRHPSGVDYEWLDDLSPLAVPWSELPAVDDATARQALEACAKYIDRNGRLERQGGSLVDGGQAEYDLQDSTEVEYEGEQLTWGELRDSLDAAGGFGNLKRADGEFGDSNGVHFYRAQGSGDPCAHDFIYDTTHWDATVPERLTLPLPGSETSTADSMFTPPELAELLTDVVILNDKSVRRLSDPTRAYALDGFCMNRKHWRMLDPDSPPSRPKTVEITAVWKRSPEALRADFAELRPDHPDENIVIEGHNAILNTYLPPAHDTPGGEVDTALDFIRHLVPIERERELFLDWHALKVARPSNRQHGLVMVTSAFGTGRGTWNKIMARLLGEQYVKEVPFAQIAGRGSQSQYNEFLSDALLINVPEALDLSEDHSRWHARRNAYEHLKQICEPDATHKMIARKYGTKSTERVYASIAISTNHVDALAIEPGDRRLIVLTNTDTPLIKAGDDLYERIHEWRRESRNITALHRWFMARAADARRRYDPCGEPMMTTAKEDMIESGQSDIDRCYEYFMEEAKGDVVTFGQWRTFARNKQLECGLDFPDTNLDRLLQSLLQRRAKRTGLGGTRIRVAGRTERLWSIRDCDRWQRCDNRELLRKEVQKNDQLATNVVKLPPRKD